MSNLNVLSSGNLYRKDNKKEIKRITTIGSMPLKMPSFDSRLFDSDDGPVKVSSLVAKGMDIVPESDSIDSGSQSVSE